MSIFSGGLMRGCFTPASIAHRMGPTDDGEEPTGVFPVKPLKASEEYWRNFFVKNRINTTFFFLGTNFQT